MNQGLGVIIGVRVDWPDRGATESLEEQVFAATRSLLTENELSMGDVDGVVTASSDLLDGRAISLMVNSGSVGGPGRDVVNTCSSSEHALVWGLARSATGGYGLQVIVSWARPSETPVDRVERLALEPIYARQLPATPLDYEALRASRMVLDHPGAAPRQEIAYASWPLPASSLRPLRDVVVAMLVASPDWCAAKGRHGVRVTGMGWMTGAYLLSERLDEPLASTLSSVRRALAQAGRTLEECRRTFWDLRTDQDAPFLVRELGLAPRGEEASWIARHQDAHRWRRDTDSRFADGLINVADAATVTGRAMVTLAHAQSGIAGQSASAFVLETP